MRTIRRIDVMSAGKMYGVIGAAIGLIIGAIISFMSVVGGALMTGVEGADAGFTGMLFGAGALVMFPIMYGIMMFISGVIGAWIYNMAAGVIGGVQIELD